MKKKRVSTDSLIKNIFDPVLNAGTLAEEPLVREQSVFFKKTLQIEPAPPGALENPFKEKILFWAALATILFLGTHLILSFLEKDSRVRNEGAFLRAKQRQAGVLENKLLEKKTEWSRLKQSLEKTRRQKESLQTSVQFLEKAVRQEPAWSRLLVELGQRDLEGVWLEELTMERGEIWLKGHSFSQARSSRFLDSLRQSSYFKNPRLQSLEAKKDAGGGVLYSFEVHAYVP